MKCAICISLILTAVARTAYPDDDKAADALIARGLELRRQGEALEALKLFRQANAIDPTPRSFGQLGLAESAIEYWSDAEEHLGASLAFPEDPWVRRNRATLDQAFALVRSHIGQISLTGPTGASIAISGKPVGPLPLAKPIRVNVGPAIVTATAPGFKLFEMSVPVEAGKETQLQVVLEPIPLEAAPPAARAEAAAPLPSIDLATSRSLWPGATLLGAGAALAAWGIVWIAVDGHSSGGACAPLPASTGCEVVYNTRSAGFAIVSVGVAAASTGAFLLYRAVSRGPELGVAVGPAALLMSGRF